MFKSILTENGKGNKVSPLTKILFAIVTFWESKISFLQ